MTVPVKTPVSTTSRVKLCFKILANSEPVEILGVRTPIREAAVSAKGETLEGRFGVEYLAPGNRSWWSRGLSVARHIGIGRAVSGTWVAVLIVVLASTVATLALWLTSKELS